MTKLALATPSLDAYSETFIRAHIGRLPADITVLYGGTPPTHIGDGSPIVPPFTLGRHLRWAVERGLRRLTWEDRLRCCLVRALQRLQAEAVLAEYGPMGVSVMEACAEAGIPLVVHFHGYDAYRQDVLAAEGQRYPELFENAAALVAVSRDMERQLRSLGAPEEKLHYNPYGVDTAFVQQADPAEAAPVFLAVGRFVDKKAPLLTLLAFARVLTDVPDARLLMIGDGPLLESSKQLARAMALDRAVEFRGARPHADVLTTMRRARAFVQHSLRTSYGDSEGTPVALLEACAAGLPVICTRHAGIAEAVADGESGLLVEEGDVDGMTAAMLRVARDADLARRLGGAARKHIEEHFTMEKRIDGLWRIIDGAIRGR